MKSQITRQGEKDTDRLRKYTFHAKWVSSYLRPAKSYPTFHAKRVSSHQFLYLETSDFSPHYFRQGAFNFSREARSTWMKSRTLIGKEGSGWNSLRMENWMLLSKRERGGVKWTCFAWKIVKYILKQKISTTRLRLKWNYYNQMKSPYEPT